MDHLAHTLGAIFMYALLFGAFIAALTWRVRVRLRAHDFHRSEHPEQVLPVCAKPDSDDNQ